MLLLPANPLDRGGSIMRLWNGTPVGVQSGWEELAAFFMNNHYEDRIEFELSLGWLADDINTVGRCIHYKGHIYDWFVEAP